MKEIQLASSAASGADFTSGVLDLGDIKDFSIHIDFSSATLNGSLTLQASNDNSDFADVSSSTQAVTSGASHIWAITGATYRYVRYFWDYTSGAGTQTARAVLKENVFKGA